MPKAFKPILAVLKPYFPARAAVSVAASLKVLLVEPGRLSPISITTLFLFFI
jgi:hypothetical protein